MRCRAGGWGLGVGGWGLRLITNQLTQSSLMLSDTSIPKSAPRTTYRKARRAISSSFACAGTPCLPEDKFAIAAEQIYMELMSFKFRAHPRRRQHRRSSSQPVELRRRRHTPAIFCLSFTDWPGFCAFRAASWPSSAADSTVGIRGGNCHRQSTAHFDAKLPQLTAT